MTYPSPSAPVSTSLHVAPRKQPPTNPRDVAELFGWLNVENLRYREFQLPDEPSASEQHPAPFSASPVSAPVSKPRVIEMHPRSR